MADDRPSFFQSIKAVAWSFFGVRRRKDHEADFSKLNPVHVIIAGIGMAAVFVISLVMLARFAVGHAVGQ